MFNLALGVLFFLGIGQTKAAPTCRDANANITEILNSTQTARAVPVADPEAVAQARKNLNIAPQRVPAPGVSPASEVNLFQNQVNANQGRLGRAFGTNKETDAGLVIEDDLRHVKTLIADAKYQDQADSLVRIKKELLQLKFLKNKEVKDLSYEELRAIQQELLLQRRSLGYTSFQHGADFNEEAMLLKEIENELKKRPEFREAQQLALSNASEQYRQHQSTQAIEARRLSNDPAALPLTSDQRLAVEKATTLLRTKPRGLTEDEVIGYRKLKLELEKRRDWKSVDGQQQGILAQDQGVTDTFLREVTSAVTAQAPGTMHTAEAAKTQGRVISRPTHDVNTVDQMGTPSRTSLVNTHAAAKTSSSEDKIQTALNRASAGSGKSIQNLAEYLPIIDSGEMMNGLVAKLESLNISRDQLVSINVISTLKPSDIDKVPGDYARAEQFFHQMKKHSSSGKLGQSWEHFSEAEKTAIRKLSSFLEALEKDYIPPARRIAP